MSLEQTLEEKLKFLKQLLTPKPADIPVPAFIEKYLTTTPEAPAKFATIFSEETKRLAGHGPV